MDFIRSTGPLDLPSPENVTHLQCTVYMDGEQCMRRDSKHKVHVFSTGDYRVRTADDDYREVKVMAAALHEHRGHIGFLNSDETCYVEVARRWTTN